MKNKPGRPNKSYPLPELIRRYRAGEQVPALAKELGVTRNAIYSRLHRAGLSIRPRLLGPGGPQWKGGTFVDSQGYIHKWVASGTYKAEHRIVMEQVLGRTLHSREHVHHLNGNRTDNRPENLTVTDPARHERWTVVHQLQHRIRDLESEIAHLKSRLPQPGFDLDLAIKAV